MAKDFYSELLGLPAGERPPAPWQLLGEAKGSRDLGAIERAANAQLERLDRYALSRDPAVRAACQRLMNEVAQARNAMAAEASRPLEKAPIFDNLAPLAELPVAAATESGLPNSPSTRESAKRLAVLAMAGSGWAIAVLLLVLWLLGGRGPRRDVGQETAAQGDRQQVAALRAELAATRAERDALTAKVAALETTTAPAATEAPKDADEAASMPTADRASELVRRAEGLISPQDTERTREAQALLAQARALQPDHAELGPLEERVNEILHPPAVAAPAETTVSQALRTADAIRRITGITEEVGPTPRELSIALMRNAEQMLPPTGVAAPRGSVGADLVRAYARLGDTAQARQTLLAQFQRVAQQTAAQEVARGAAPAAFESWASPPAEQELTALMIAGAEIGDTQAVTAQFRTMSALDQAGLAMRIGHALGDGASPTSVEAMFKIVSTLPTHAAIKTPPIIQMARRMVARQDADYASAVAAASKIDDPEVKVEVLLEITEAEGFVGASLPIRTSLANELQAALHKLPQNPPRELYREGELALARSKLSTMRVIIDWPRYMRSHPDAQHVEKAFRAMTLFGEACYRAGQRAEAHQYWRDAQWRLAALGSQRWAALQALVTSQCRAGATAEALVVIRQEEDPDFRDRAVQALVNAPAEPGSPDHGRRLEAVAAASKPELRAELYLALAKKWAEAGDIAPAGTALDRAIESSELVRNRANRGPDVEHARVMVSLGRIDEAEAISKSFSMSERGRLAAAAVDATLKTDDVESALRLARKIEDEDSRQRAVASVGRALAKHGAVSGARALLADLEQPRLRDEVAGACVDYLLENEKAPLAFQLVEDLHGAFSRLTRLRGIARAFAAAGDEESLRTVLDACRDDTDRAGVLWGFAEALSTTPLNSDVSDEASTESSVK